MPSTYVETLSAFTQFLTAYVHTIVCLRDIYPRSSFVQSRFHNTPVYHSRHPSVCEWIQDAISAVRDELVDGTVAKLGIVIYNYGDGDGSRRNGGDLGSVKIMERYMLDVSSFPVLEKNQRHKVITYADLPPEEVLRKNKQGPIDVDVNLGEEFRAALIRLTTRVSRLDALPPNCSFNISMELRDEGLVDPPMGHPKPWVPVQPSLQVTGRKGSRIDFGRGGSEMEGEDLGGEKVTPIRTVQVGAFRFETWVEEGKAKFEMNEDIASTLDSFAS